MKKIIIFSLFITLFLAGKAVAAEPTVKIKDNAYSARFVSQSEQDPVAIEAGATKTITIKFKNVGSINWDSGKSHFISAYTMEPRDRESVFSTTGWISKKQTGKIAGVIKPGQTGELSLTLKAPSKTGDYVEHFYLAAENYSWVQGGYFFLKIKVVPAKKVSQVENTASSTTESSSTVATGYGISKIIWSKKEVSGAGGDQVKVIMAWQNSGKNTWSEYQLIGPANTRSDTWVDESNILAEDVEIKAQGILRKEFYFNLPAKQGSYQAEFMLNIDNGKIKQSIVIPLTVLSDAPGASGASTGVVNSSTDQVLNTLSLVEEPRIRVGLTAPESNFIQFRSYDDEYRVIVNGEEKGILPIKRFAVIKYEDGQYNFKGGDLEFDSDSYIRLEPVNNPRAVFKLLNFNRSANWIDPNSNFNDYRGAFEYRQGAVDKKMYVVEDTLLEDYVRGMAENSKLAPPEFLKANLIAARTYAYVSRGKYPFFDLVGNTSDQLYLGADAEKVLTNVQEAAEATTGMMVTYDGQVVITPYFGHSNGKTKSWTQVWGGSAKPWLVPVVCNYDKGLSMFGHGVGMSQLDAANRADKEGINFVELLKYYYTGVEVEKLY